MREQAATDARLLDRRRRAHLALLAVVLAVSSFGYMILQPRTVHVQADGRTLVFETHESHDGAVVGSAEIGLRTGDRIIALDGDGADVLRVDRARRLTLVVDGTAMEVYTHAATIGQLLEEVGIALGDRDSVAIDGSLAPLNARFDSMHLAEDAQARIDVLRAMRFVVVERGQEIVSTTSRPTIAQALREAGVVIGPGDRVLPALDAPVTQDARVEIAHAHAVTLALPDDHRVLYTFAATVGDVLAEASVTLPEGAFVDPPFETPVTDDMSVRVVQLSASRDIETEYLESRTVYRLDPSLAPGQTRTVPGRDGALVRRYEVAYVNGVEAGRDLIEEHYDPEPVDTVVYYPAPPPDTGIPSAGVARVLNVYATYYTPASAGRPPTDPNYGVTATGVLVTYGIVAVDPNVIPLGTRMYIPGYGYAVAADTGGAVKGYIIDLGYPDGVDVPWRPRWLDIYILE